jgi:hypothetical protein
MDNKCMEILTEKFIDNLIKKILPEIKYIDEIIDKD